MGQAGGQAPGAGGAAGAHTIQVTPQEKEAIERVSDTERLKMRVPRSYIASFPVHERVAWYTLFAHAVTRFL